MIAGALGLVSSGPACALGQDRLAEYAVKAAYLAKFALFVDWPPGAAPSGEDPLQLCILGPDPFGPGLPSALADGRPVLVRRLDSTERVGGCHVLYFAEADSRAVTDGLKAVRGAPVLTVTDAARQAAARGIIHFEVRAKRVRFHIDDRMAGEHRLVVSSRLMALALSVRRRRA